MLVVEERKNTKYEKEYIDLSNKIKELLKTKNKKFIGITSVKKWEGKSTVAVNLAFCLAESGVKTLLIDCNIKRPSIHRKLEIENNGGFNRIINGDFIKDELVINKKENLDVLTAKEDYIDIKIEKEFSRIVEDIKDIGKSYDCVIVDGVAIEEGVDYWYKALQGVVMVVKNNEIKREELIVAKNRISNTGGEIIGVVLNGIK